MKKRIFHIILLLLAHIGYAQNLPSSWVPAQKTSDSCIFKFKKLKLTINNKTFSPSTDGALAIFAFDSSKKLYECVGYNYIYGDSATVIAYAQDTSHPNGYTEGTTYQLLYWSTLNKCQTIMNWDSSAASQLRKGHLFVIDSLSGNSSSIYYPSNTYSKKDSDPFPYNNDGISVSFFNNGARLIVVDSINGKINLQASAIGSSTITFKSDYCLTANSAVITITDTVMKSAPDSISVNIIDPTCTIGGIIMAKVIGDTTNKWNTFEIKNTTTGTTYSNTSGIFDNLSDGVYALAVLNDTNGRYDYPGPLLIARPNDCNNPIIAPDSKNGLQTLYIKEQGAGKILNSEGQLVKEMSLPSEWDGLDNKGNPVPMGDYYLFVNGKQNKIITVIR